MMAPLAILSHYCLKPRPDIDIEELHPWERLPICTERDLLPSQSRSTHSFVLSQSFSRPQKVTARFQKWTGRSSATTDRRPIVVVQ